VVEDVGPEQTMYCLKEWECFKIVDNAKSSDVLSKASVHFPVELEQRLGTVVWKLSERNGTRKEGISASLQKKPRFSSFAASHTGDVTKTVKMENGIDGHDAEELLTSGSACRCQGTGAWEVRTSPKVSSTKYCLAGCRMSTQQQQKCFVQSAREYEMVDARRRG